MSVLNYMVTKETSINPALLEGVTQENLHDHIGANAATSCQTAACIVACCWSSTVWARGTW